MSEREKKRPTVIKSKYTLLTGTSTDLEELPINRTGNLVAINVLPTESIGPFADMFIGVELSFTAQKTQIILIRGYLKKSFSLNWTGRIPTDTESKLILEHLNASGESQIIELAAVIEPE